MRGRLISSLFLIAVLLLACSVSASDIPAPPKTNIYLADYAKMVGEEDGKEILAIGKDLDTRFKAQLVVVTVDTLGGQDLESYANRLFRAWGIGDAKKNNGILLLVAKDDRKFRIEVGYGLEGAITDGYAGEVLDGMKEPFKAGEYSAGILKSYMKLAAKVYDEYGEALPESVKVSADVDKKWTLRDWLFAAVAILVAIVVILLFEFIKCTALYILNLLLYLISFGHFGSLKFRDSYSSVYFWRSGSGSGGFGGGSSGGGGASGGW